MTQIDANGIHLEYETFGPASGEPLLLVMGLGAQLTLWAEPFCQQLVDKGFYVIRFDNRDVGLSSKFGHKGLPDLMKILEASLTGQKPEMVYELKDMADDAVALLDALNIPAAHIVGASMGGMIVQHMAFGHPEKVKSLTSIMSTTGHAGLSPAAPDAMAVLMSPAPDASDVDAVVARGIQAQTTIAGPVYAKAPEDLEKDVLRDFHRSYYPEGVLRQMAAVVGDGDRRARLAGVKCPSLVIHGDIDPLVPVDGGRDTAAHITGAEYLEFEGMGHSVPEALYEQIVSAIATNTARVAQAAE